MSRGWDVQKLSEFYERRNRAGDKRTGPRAVDEKQQDADPWKAHHKTRVPRVDRAVHPKFRVTVTLYVADQRRRDADGAYTTILDALVKSVRRLGSVDCLRTLRGSESQQG